MLIRVIEYNLYKILSSNPKKRPRAVQRQLDSLFTGLWLTEVSANAYKVPEILEAGKLVKLCDSNGGHYHNYQSSRSSW